jgi:hypothetical protein
LWATHLVNAALVTFSRAHHQNAQILGGNRLRSQRPSPGKTTTPGNAARARNSEVPP